jgi:deazaflavin-dependent oxidoreductase (nitroreductase family)
MRPAGAAAFDSARGGSARETCSRRKNAGVRFVPADMSDYNRRIIEEFRASAGRVGGRWEGRDLLLLTTTGRKSGNKYTTPMVYTRDGDRLLVYASDSGAPTHPDWYLNLVADPEVVVEIGSERYEARATPLEGGERDREYAAQIGRVPAFGEYQENTTRGIPVVALTRPPQATES